MPNKSAQAIISNFKKLPLDEQTELSIQLSQIAAQAVVAYRKKLVAELDRLDRKEKAKAAVKKTRVKAPAKYQSKRDKSLKWSGRGSTPTWLREEMKGSRLKLESFLIAKKK